MTVEEEVKPEILKLLKKSGLEIMLRTILNEVGPVLKEDMEPAYVYLKMGYDIYKGRHMDKQIYFQSRSAPEFRFLSNFHPAPFSIGPALYPTVEHYYQAAKTTNENDFRHVMASKTPGEARRRGQSVKMPELWPTMKDGVMLTALREKFGQNPDLAEMLLATDGFELIEYAPWGDTYWGVDKDKIGRNMLGKLLMIVRDELKEKK